MFQNKTLEPIIKGFDFGPSRNFFKRGDWNIDCSYILQDIITREGLPRFVFLSWTYLHLSALSYIAFDWGHGILLVYWIVFCLPSFHLYWHPIFPMLTNEMAIFAMEMYKMVLCNIEMERRWRHSQQQIFSVTIVNGLTCFSRYKQYLTILINVFIFNVNIKDTNTNTIDMLLKYYWEINK